MQGNIEQPVVHSSPSQNQEPVWRRLSRAKDLVANMDPSDHARQSAPAPVQASARSHSKRESDGRSERRGAKAARAPALCDGEKLCSVRREHPKGRHHPKLLREYGRSRHRTARMVSASERRIRDARKTIEPLLLFERITESLDLCGEPRAH